MDIVTYTFNKHNETTKCNCSCCNIVRMCDEMKELTDRTHALVARYRGDFTNDRVSARI